MAMITQDQYKEACAIVFSYEKQEADKRKQTFIEKYKGKTKDDIVTVTVEAGRPPKRVYNLFVVDMTDDLASIIEHETDGLMWWTIRGNRREHKTYQSAFNVCCEKLKRKGYIN